MNDQELFGQLHKLSKMSPDPKWKESQRALLFNQINYNEAESANRSTFGDLFLLPLNFVQNLSQPIIASFLVGFFILTGGMFSLRAAQDTKPGDSLYIAKIAGEKTQLALAFSEKKKAQLGLEFATNRAVEIKKVMNEEMESPTKEVKMEKLVNDYNKELNIAKERIGKISENSSLSVKKNDLPVEPVATVPVEIADSEVASIENETDTAGGQIFSAGSNRDEKGIEVFVQTTNTPEVATKTAPTEEKSLPVATTTAGEQASSNVTETVETVVPTKTPEEILVQVGELLKSDSFNEALDILNNAGEAIDIKVKEEVEQEVAE